MIRQKIQKKRQSLMDDEIKRRSQRIEAKLKSILTQSNLPFRRDRIGIYRNLRTEVRTLPLAKWLRQEGSDLHFPKVWDPKNRQLEFLHVPKLEGSEYWKKGPLGLIEPDSSLPAADPQNLELMIIPGVAFGKKQGERVGHGHGYYDRYLKRASQAFRIALAFDFQLFSWLQQHEWDQQMDWIMTDSQLIETYRGQVPMVKWKDTPSETP